MRSRVVAHFIRGFLHPTEAFIHDQVENLQEFRPIVCCHHRMQNLTYPSDKVYALQELLPPGARRLDSLCYKTARYLPATSARWIADLLQREGVSLLHFHYLAEARFFHRVKLLTNLPAVVSTYGYDVSSFPKKFMGAGRHYLKPAIDEMDRFLAMSEDMNRDLIALGCPPEKISIHYHGINTDRFVFPERSYEKKDIVSILMCGSLNIKKAQDNALQALRLWEKRGTGITRFKIVIVGKGPLRSRLDQLIAEYGWQDRVEFTGVIPYIEQRFTDQYKNADIFVLPSITTKDGQKEGIPGTLIQAMSSGLPVVATYHAGNPEMITDGINGFLTTENDLEGLATALGKLIESHELRKQLGQAAVEKALRDCRLEPQIRKLEQIYSEML